MRYLVLLALFFSALARAEVLQVPTDLICSDRKTLLEVLDKYSEQPLLRGQGRTGWVVIYVNPETHTWTMVERVEQDLYCYVSAGQEFSPVEPEVRRGFLDQRRGRYN